jgi:outer membrane protein OmpA-like peptidoglycan-associated protein
MRRRRVPLIADDFSAIRATMESKAKERDILRLCRALTRHMQDIGVVMLEPLERSGHNAEPAVSKSIPAPDRLVALGSRIIRFDFNSDEVANRSRDDITAVARVAEKMGAASIRVEGYAFRTERFLGDCTPLYLAARRATVVSAELRKALAYADCPIPVRNMETVAEMHILDPIGDPGDWSPFVEITLEESNPPPTF